MNAKGVPPGSGPQLNVGTDSNGGLEIRTLEGVNPLTAFPMPLLQPLGQPAKEPPVGYDPTTSSLPKRCSTTELWRLAPPPGFEPGAKRLTVVRSTAELRGKVPRVRGRGGR